MTLADLIAIAPPPVEPVDDRGDWARVEGRIGLTLPADYKAFIETYTESC